MTAKVSVILPVYNAEKYLPATLDSLLKQTYRNLEIIGVNDGSTDASEEIIRRYAQGDSRVVLLSQKNQGVSAARNYGLRRAEGDYLAFLDADDFIDEDTYEKMVETARMNHADMVICGFNHYHNETVVPVPSSIKGGLYTEKKLEELRQELVFPTTEHYFHAYLFTCFVRRDLVEKISLRFDEGLRRSEDYLFLVTLIRNVKRLYVMEERKVYYRKHPASITHNYLSGYWSMVQDIYLKLKAQGAPLERLQLMLVARARNAIYLETLAQDSLSKRYWRARAIVKHPLIREATASIGFKAGKRGIGMSYYFFKLGLTLPIFVQGILTRKRLPGGRNDDAKD